MRRFKGYMTVEAAVVIPVVIFVFASLIYFSSYLYTKCVLSQDCYVLAFRASNNNDEKYDSDMGGYVMNKSAKVAGGKYYGSSAPAFRAVVNGKKIEVWGSTIVRHAAIGRAFKKLGGGWEIEMHQIATKRDYAGHIRTVKRIKDIGLKE
ncbi:MAG: pilus assembly protein [Butyrivibrio sp.]|nr:pilus assembly protein [Butyrivibrio sp.]